MKAAKANGKQQQNFQMEVSQATVDHINLGTDEKAYCKAVRRDELEAINALDQSLIDFHREKFQDFAAREFVLLENLASEFKHLRTGEKINGERHFTTWCKRYLGVSYSTLHRQLNAIKNYHAAPVPQEDDTDAGDTDTDDADTDETDENTDDGRRGKTPTPRRGKPSQTEESVVQADAAMAAADDLCALTVQHITADGEVTKEAGKKLLAAAQAYAALRVQS